MLALTSRQATVIKYRANGLIYREIATRLGISVKRVGQLNRIARDKIERMESGTILSHPVFCIPDIGMRLQNCIANLGNIERGSWQAYEVSETIKRISLEDARDAIGCGIKTIAALRVLKKSYGIKIDSASTLTRELAESMAEHAIIKQMEEI